jgi:hypothetical protein
VQETLHRLGSDDFDALATVLLESTPPLLYWTGAARPLLVPASAITSHTIDLPVANGESAKLRVLPRLWTDFKGGFVYSAWAMATRAVLKQIHDAPGSTSVRNFSLPVSRTPEAVSTGCRLRQADAGARAHRGLRSPRTSPG